MQVLIGLIFVEINVDGPVYRKILKKGAFLVHKDEKIFEILVSTGWG